MTAPQHLDDRNNTKNSRNTQRPAYNRRMRIIDERTPPGMAKVVSQRKQPHTGETDDPESYRRHKSRAERLRKQLCLAVIAGPKWRDQEHHHHQTERDAERTLTQNHKRDSQTKQGQCGTPCGRNALRQPCRHTHQHHPRQAEQKFSCLKHEMGKGAADQGRWYRHRIEHEQNAGPGNHTRCDRDRKIRF